MKNTIKWLGIIVLVTVIGFSMISCGPEDEGNPFLGEWEGKINYEGQKEAMINFTESEWVISVPDIPLNESGTYTYQGGMATLRQGNATLGSAAIALNIMTVTIATGVSQNSTGTFSKPIGSLISLRPGMPRNVSAAALSSTSIRISWTAPSFGTPVKYNILRSDSLSGTYVDVGSVAGTVFSFDNTSLSPSTRYYYKVDAENASTTRGFQSFAVNALTNPSP